MVPGEVNGGFGRDLRNLFSFDTRSIAVGVTMQIPIRNRTAEANVAGAKLQNKQLATLIEGVEQAIEADVRNAAQTVETSRRQVLSARAARRSADVQLAGERKLYQTGLSTTFLVFQRENQLTVARGIELRAEADYNKAQAILQRATATTLRANNIEIADSISAH